MEATLRSAPGPPRLQTIRFSFRCLVNPFCREHCVRMNNPLRSLSVWLAGLLLFLAAAPVAAAVQITFYSKELGASFPHAFVILEGTLDRTGERIAEDYGFTAKTVSPAILMGRVKGEVVSDHKPDYVRASDKHFTLTISDEDYDRVIATIERWRTAKQPSYSLDKANCIHFVGEIATSLGMDGSPRKGLMRRPRSFLEALTAENRPWLVAHDAVFHRVGKAAAAPGA